MRIVIVVFFAEKFVQIVDEVMTVKEEKDEGNTKKEHDLDEFFSQKHHYTILIWALLLSHRKRMFYNRIWVRCWHSGDASPSPNLHSPGNAVIHQRYQFILSR